MITLKKLRWSNCFSYGADNEIDLDDSTVTQIVGTNGMGKSSIPLIIEEALYNKNSKGIKKADIPNRYINSGYDIYLSFTVDSTLYEITITRRGTIKVRLEQDGLDISSHTATDTYKNIQAIIGVDFKTFSQLVYQNTNSSLQFLTATDTNRKKFLIDLLHLEEYVKLFEVFKEVAKESTYRINSINAQVNTIEKWLKDNILADTYILPLIELEINTEEDEKLLRLSTVELQNISEINKKIISNNQYKKMLDDIDISSTYPISATEILSYDHLQGEAGSLAATIKNCNTLLAKLLQLEDHCPTCEQAIDTSFKSELIKIEQETIKAAKDKLANEINPEITKIRKNNSDFQHKVAIEKEWTDLYKSIDYSMDEKPIDRVELDTRIEDIRSRIAKAKETLDATTKENEKRIRKNTRIQVIQEQTEKFQEELTSTLDSLSKEQAVNINLEILKKAFSTNGLLAYKIENLVKELEALVNTYLSELSDGRFTLAFVVSNDKLNVEVTDDGNNIDILALSSGELARVNTATLIAIRKLMSSISKSKLNILFLDEVINVLDEVGREKLIEVLLGEEDLNTYIVSHAWTHPLLNKIEIVKKGNISGLEK